MIQEKTLRFLISSVALPSEKVGSWTNRITELITENPGFFDFVLSPTSNPTKSNIPCKKRKWLHLPQRFKSWELESWIAKEYIDIILNKSKTASKIQLLIMDDQILLEAMTLIKNRLSIPIEIVYSFHGHSLRLAPQVIQKVDKILFLTEAGYQDSLNLNEVFTPLVYIVGNGVDSKRFFPLSASEKLNRKLQLGYSKESKLLIWMSNDREKKGMHLFKKVSKKLQEFFPELNILIIGGKKEADEKEESLRMIGKIPNHELPYYLQAGDFYFFTSLWKEGFGLSMVEAAKCGNFIFASKNGGIPEVLNGFKNSMLIDSPNSIDAWIEAFGKAYNQETEILNLSPEYLNSFHPMTKWKMDYLNALLD
ncbi:glycosyltransferase family 4 protein [Algoriphagus aestuarii]|nr:glycosyltransferase family 4 protein [Algoriphagus aestuarii]